MDHKPNPANALDEYVYIEIQNERKKQERILRWVFAGVAICVLGWWILPSFPITTIPHLLPFFHPSLKTSKSNIDIEAFRQCSTDSFLSSPTNRPDTLPPAPSLSEYVQRRNNLAIALLKDGIDAFIMEPGYAMLYHANVSQTDWEPWEPEERVFGMIIVPDWEEGENGEAVDVVARTRFLAPNFEVERVRLLGMPFTEGRNIEVLGWEEHWDPYKLLFGRWEFGTARALSESLSNSKRKPKIMVDEEMRDFIQRGLGGAGFEVVGLGGEVERVRQTKSEVEVEILREVNTRTVEAVRAVRRCLAPGLREKEVQEVLDDTLRAGGLEPFFDIVLFDENASNPHGGTNGSKVLDPETFVLIDVGAHLHHYSSDISRTFFPPFPSQPANVSTLPTRLQHKIKIFSLVLAAQAASLTALVPNNTVASVDIAARSVISSAGYGKQFTHRVGHGIGIKAHESPYLHQGNTETMLREGMCFTSEPGVYLVGEFGVRTEDVLLVHEGGPVCLSGRRAIGPWDP